METLAHYNNIDLERLLNYTDYDFESNKPDPRLNAHFVPIYLFFKIAKELGREVKADSDEYGTGFRFQTEKSQELFGVWFSLDRATPLKTFLGISWTESGSGDCFLNLRGQITETKDTSPQIELYFNKSSIEASLEFLNGSNYGYSIKSNETMMLYYKKLVSELKDLL